MIVCSGILTPTTSTAHAECACVLWQNIETVAKLEGDGTFSVKWDPDSWTPAAAYTSRTECVNAMGGVVKQWPKGVKVGDWRNTYICLPDTVDPRGLRAR